MDKKLDCTRCGQPLSEHAAYNALAEIKQTKDGFELVEDKLLPVVPHICESCGYIELYVPTSMLK
ncbi:hypothetical protein [Paenibacillus woosongensis]|uniref:YgiT-type zinc finger protein n=1 Tax=Paenibacillus woosongensis TaxID=307580 RepID=A0ABQ4MPJ5_9BACL|nr:hypothetical protein [Paenibacillus woosongensis]GIP57920.1 hypothetical protein J15TS10_17340 [Paenibacillus woosongensis]